MALSKIAAITVDNTKVSGSANLTDFPMLVSGTYAGSGTDPDFRTVANGGDIENTDAAGGVSGSLTVPADFAFFSDVDLLTPLDFEIESYNAATGLIIAWVKVPTLDYNDDTVIYVGYSDSGITTTQEDIANTWASEYRAVYHFAESSGSLLDSTSNGNDLNDNNTVGAGAGKVNGARDYERGNSEFSRATSYSNIPKTGDLSVAIWVNMESLAALAPTLTVGGVGESEAENQVWNLIVETNGGLSLRWEYGAGTNQDVFSTTTGLISTGTFFRVVVERDTTAKTVKFIVGGVLINTVGYANNATGGSTADLLMGSDGNLTVFMDGLADEGYIINGLKGIDWWATEFENQDDPSTFYSIATVQPNPNVTFAGEINVQEEVEAEFGGEINPQELLESEFGGEVNPQEALQEEFGGEITGAILIPRPLQYRIIIYDENDSPIGEMSNFKGLKFGKRLNNYGKAEFKIRLDDTKLSSLVSLRRYSVYIYREQGLFRNLVWAGEQAMRYSDLMGNKNNWSTIFAFTWLEQLKDRFTEASVTYDDIEATSIGWDLIDDTQTKTNGDFGITQGTLGTTTNRDRTYNNDNILQALIDLTNVISGFDMEVTDLKVFNAQSVIGTDKTDSIVLEYGKNIVNAQVTEDFVRPVNSAIVLGQAYDETSLQRIVRNDGTLQSTYKLRELRIQEMDISGVSTFQDKGDAAIRKFGTPLLKVDFDLVGNSSPSIVDFGLGDGVTLKIQEGLFNINEEYRVFEWEVEVNEKNVERLSLVLGKLTV
jgi:hypothetical protein